jgi:hypothetical protein
MAARPMAQSGLRAAGTISPATFAKRREPAPGFFGRAWRAARWFMLGSLILTVALALHRAPAPGVRSDPQAAADAARKLADARKQVRAGHPAEVRLTQSELTSFLDANLALSREAGDEAAAAPAPSPSSAGDSAAREPAPAANPSLDQARSSVRDVKITMAGDRLRAYVLFGFHGETLSLALEGRLAVAGGNLRFAPLDGEIGSLPLPETALEAAVSRMMDSPENRDTFRVPDDIRDIRVENGELVIQYR